MLRWMLILLVVMFVQTAVVIAQEAPVEVPPEPWQHDVLGALALSQVALKDWSQGGENALAWTLSLDGKTVNDVPKSNWSTTYKFAFGQTKLGDQSVRKTDDKIDLETLFTYKLGVYVNPYVAATLKTQFAKGFQYGDDGSETAASKLFDPAYITQSSGFGYEPIPQVKTRLGLALREIVTSEFTGFADDPETAELEKTKVDGGLESVTEVAWKFAGNTLLTSKLELFTAFKQIDEVAVRSDSTIATKVSKYITVKFNVQIIHDKTASEKTQVKETLTLGLSYTLL